MNLKDKAKSKAKQKVKKIVFKAIKPFLPFILIIALLFFAICSIIDAIFIQEVQSDNSLMTPEQLQLKEKCIQKSEYLNTCHNYKDNELTNYLLDIDSRETDKEIQWSHLYAIMAFQNMTDNTKINEMLLNEIASNFESTFKYEKMQIKTETITKDENGKESISNKEETAYILVESDTIMGHYKYNYEEKTIEKDNTKVTKKVFTNEELIGKQYERLEKFLKNKLHIRQDDIDIDVQVIIQASNGYYEGEENTSWLQGSSSSDTIITDGKGLVPTRYVYLANTWIYNYNISFWYENTSNNSVYINCIVVLIYQHQFGAKFVAMADGVVIKAAYNSAYGNMVMIDHGNGIVTLYAHGSEILVKTNQIVTQGQAVLKVGSTGYSTGPHAHFEIRINGNFANPEDYFK